MLALRATLRRANVAEATRDEILSRLDRRLMAVLAADVVGYSGAMERDETGTPPASRRFVVGSIRSSGPNGGDITGTAGDSVSAVVPSTLAAVDCAVRLHLLPTAADGPRFRVGVNVGDVIRQNGDVFGDTVNVADRPESLAEAGGTCVSRAVRDHVAKQRRFAFDGPGLQAVKNLAEPISVYRMRSLEATRMGEPEGSGSERRGRAVRS